MDLSVWTPLLGLAFVALVLSATPAYFGFGWLRGFAADVQWALETLAFVCALTAGWYAKRTWIGAAVRGLGGISPQARVVTSLLLVLFVALAIAAVLPHRLVAGGVHPALVAGALLLPSAVELLPGGSVPHLVTVLTEAAVQFGLHLTNGWFT